MYSYDDPVGFISAFYGCLIAGVAPVPIDPPVKKEVSASLMPRVMITLNTTPYVMVMFNATPYVMIMFLATPYVMIMFEDVCMQQPQADLCGPAN